MLVLAVWLQSVDSIASAQGPTTGDSPAETHSADVSSTEPLGVAIAKAAERSVEQLDAEAIEGVEAAMGEFLQADAELRAHLELSTDQTNAQAWIDYLELDAVLGAIESEARDAEIAAKSTRLSHKATGIHPGLEVPAVTRLRAAAMNLSNALRFRSKENTTKLLGIQLGRFADQWSAIESVPTPDETATLSLLLDLLQRTNQDVELVKDCRQRFASANLFLTIDDSLIQSVVDRRVNQCSPVRDCILGTRIVGDALLTGDVSASLLPSVGSVKLQVALTGSVISNNRGYNGPVKLRTSGVGEVHATRLIEVSESGVSFAPAVTSGSLSTRINAIEHPMRLVRRIARKKAAQQKPQADRIAHRKFISRVTEEFTEETDGAVSEPMPDLMAEARPYLTRLNLSEPQRTLGSTSESIYFNATFRDGNQLAAPSPPPVVSETNDATVQIHESMVANTIGAILAGRTMTRSELQQLAEKARPEKEQGSGTES